MKTQPTVREHIGHIMGAIAFIILAFAPMFALVAISFFDNSATGDSLMTLAQFCLYFGLTLAMIRGAYDMVFVYPN
jgi:hypothetical protein